MAVDTQAIILDMGEFWIEYLMGTTSNIAAGLYKDETFTLLRGGHFMGGCSVTSGANSSSVSSGALYCNTNTAPTIGVEVTQMRVTARNNHSLGNNMRVGYIVFLRK